jgi:phenylpyruvate tautomerase PptA (4-oxalocrotonate tautomerase family)
MPIVTITIRKPKSAAFKNTVLTAIHSALVNALVSPNDKFQRVLELDAEDFRFDPLFPDVQTERTDDFVLVEILLGIGRSVKVKKQILQDIVQSLSTTGFDPENLMVCFLDMPWENWSAGFKRQWSRPVSAHDTGSTIQCSSGRLDSGIL